MAELDSSTLMTAIQAVEIAIKQQEKMLEAEVLGDREDTEEFIFVLENAKAKLKSAYLAEQKSGSHLPDYNDLIQVRL